MATKLTYLIRDTITQNAHPCSTLAMALRNVPQDDPNRYRLEIQNDATGEIILFVPPAVLQTMVAARTAEPALQLQPALPCEETDKTHPGFTITCDTCHSAAVYVHNSLGYSDTSGQWGGVHLVCAACGHTTTIYGD